jgi:hypothetical protein
VNHHPNKTHIYLQCVTGFEPAARRYRFTANEGAVVLPKSDEPYQVQGAMLGE